MTDTPAPILAGKCTFALCSLPARERTGLVTHSLHFPLAQPRAARSLDGRTPLPPPVIPAYAHSLLDPTGL
ncbi:hypothetical protein [Burkholderia sp. Bp8992]|uniref:hypothetical protein n=1 Tax=unclassified Burkholderia TaxID=2613784 RepID=UPI0026C22D93